MGAGRRIGGGVRSSSDLLIELAQREQVSGLLGELGISPGLLAELRPEVERSLEPEPADWRLRLEQRGGNADAAQADLDELLAIVRSADCHGYKLLERAGAAPGRLRKLIIERMREVGDHGTARAAASRPIARPNRRLRTTGSGAGVRMSSGAAGHGTQAGPVDAGRPARPSLRRAPRTISDLDPHEPVPETQAQPAVQPVAATAPRPRERLHALVAADLEPLHGRGGELARLADAVLRRSPRPPLLVGAHGSGRTLLACHLATMVERPVFLLSATDYEDDVELSEDLEEVAAANGVAIFDDIDRIASDASPGFLGSLAQAWANASPPVLTVVSHEGRARLETWLPGAVETLDVLNLPPLDDAAVHEAVRAAAPAILEQHGVELDAEAQLVELTRLADRYLGGLAMPGRALDLLDLACARTGRRGHTHVTRETWVDIVCERSGVPRDRIEALGNQSMFDLEHQLAREVVGHGHVLSTLAQLIRRNRAGFTSGRPVATVLLLGPSGVGKTEIAKALCAALYDRPDALVRLDMSEYSESHAVARIVGAPPGYVGHEQGGALTDPLLEQPHCVVLLDEIEKAHRDVHQLLLQVFDDGRLTDGRGRTVDFRHAVLIMTSNLGSGEADMDPDTGDLDEEHVLASARAAFPVELWNRIEAPFVLQPLTVEEMRKVCRRLAKRSAERLFREQGIRYSLSEAACGHLVDLAGRDPALGARPLRHLLTREVESIIADAILRGKLRAGTQALVDLSRHRLVLR